MSEFFNSLAEAIKFRATTSIVGTYFTFWAVLHWQAIYTTIFVSEDEIVKKFGMLKNEYLNIYFIQPHIDNSFYWLGLLLPALGVYLWIWVLPELLFLRSFQRERDYKFKKRSRVIQDRLDLKKIEERRAVKSQSVAKKDLDAARKELKATQLELAAAKNTLETRRISKSVNSSEDPMERAFKTFMSIPQASKVLADIRQCIYEQSGIIRRANGYRLDSDSLAIADINKIISINGRDTIALTDLGKYILSRQYT